MLHINCETYLPLQNNTANLVSDANSINLQNSRKRSHISNDLAMGDRPLKKRSQSGEQTSRSACSQLGPLNLQSTQPSALGHLIPKDIFIGIDEVFRHPQQGISWEHGEKLMHFAKKHNLPIAFRPVEVLAKTLLKDGKYPTKDLKIKGKSASWGPMAAFIPVRQEFSKIAGKKADIKKYNQQIKAVLSNGNAEAMDLKISEKRLQELISLGKVSKKRSRSPDDEILELTSQAPLPDGKKHLFYAAPDGAGEFTIFDKDRSPVRVLGKNGKLIIADYDLLLVAVPIEELDERDNIPIKDVNHEVFKSRVDRYKNKPLRHPELQRFYDKKQAFYAALDPELGNSSKRVKEVLANINKNLGRAAGLEIVQHSADESNPVADFKTNYPMTFFFPKPIDTLGEVCMVMNAKRFREVVQRLLDTGYHVMRNPLWEKELAGILPTNYTAARNALEIIQWPKLPAGKSSPLPTHFLDPR